MGIRKNKSHLIYDWIVIILEITYSIAILMHLFFIIPGFKAMIALLLFMFLAHLKRFGLKFSVIAYISHNFILFVFFVILLLDVFQSLFFYNSLTKPGLVACLLLNHFFFVSYLFNLYEETHSFKYVLKPYVGYSLYNVLIIVIASVLILLGLHWEQNMLTGNIAMLSEDIEGGGIYYFPYYLCMIADYHPIRIFSVLPGLSGLSHEPHIIMWIITPALIMGMLYKSSKKIKISMILIYMFITLNSMSTTNIVCIILILLCHSIWIAFYSKEKKYLFLLCGLLMLISIVGYEFLDSAYLQVASKLESSDSRDYTSNMIHYLLSYNSMFGYGNFPPVTGEYKSGETIGLLSGLLDVVLFTALIFKSLRLLFSSSGNNHYWGSGFLYFLLHSLKVNYLLFSYPLFPFLLFLMSLISPKCKRPNSTFCQ